MPFFQSIAPELRTAILRRIFKIKGTTLNTIYRLVATQKTPELKEKIRNLVNKSGRSLYKSHLAIRRCSS